MARILLVDDDESVLSRLSTVLRQRFHEVATARNGREALRLADRTPFDLLITDIVMPEVDGLETIIGMRQRQPAIPIVAMSERLRGSLDFLSAARAFGADAILRKPVDEGTLLEAVAECLAGDVRPAPRQCRR